MAANKAYWYKADGTRYKAGDTIRFPGLARTLKRMVETERNAKLAGRAAGIAAARDRFYKGDIAQEMVAFLRQHGAPFDAADFADFYARIEEPAKTTYRGYTVYKHGFGSQGRRCCRRSTSWRTSTSARWATAAPTTCTPSPRR